MTDKKISELTNILGSQVDDANDELAIVDASTAETKAITRAELFKDIDGNITLAGTVDGRDVAADGSKLDGIESGATADQTAGEIKTAYESNADTNAFTDAEQSKLDGIEAGADVTDTTNVTAAGALMDSELTDEASVKALNQGVATTDSPDFAGLTVDTDTLYVDSTNNRVGIETSSPAKTLEVSGSTATIRINDTNRTGYSEISNAVTGGGLLLNADPAGLEGSSTIRFHIDGSEAMRIDSSGNVGIETSSPADPLHVNGNTRVGPVGGINNGTGGFLTFGSREAATQINAPFITQGSSDGDAQDLILGAHSGDGSVRIFTGASIGSAPFTSSNTERMRIDSSGNLSVGQSGTSASVVGGQIRNDGRGLFVVDGDEPLFLNRLTSDGTIIDIRQDTVQVGSVSVSGSSTSYNTSSDERLKENIADAQPASDLIDGIQVREFDWKADGEHQRYGMIAQELETVAPEAVTKGETEDDMWSVDYSKLVPMLVKEIQDLRKRVNELENTQ